MHVGLYVCMSVGVYVFSPGASKRAADPPAKPGLTARDMNRIHVRSLLDTP